MAKYIVPKKIRKLIDKEFLLLFKKNLDDAYSVNKDGQTDYLNEEHYRLSEGNGHWYKALLDTCFDLRKLEVIGYQESLEWYDSDFFDDKLVDMFIEYKII
jgi:hypothetical protein